VPFSEKGTISSRKEYGNNDQIEAERMFRPTPGYKFDLSTVHVTKLSADGKQGFEVDWDGPHLQVLSETAVKVIGTTRHHAVGTSGHLEFQVTADQIRV
jgi:hypothetical protein